MIMELQGIVVSRERIEEIMRLKLEEEMLRYHTANCLLSEYYGGHDLYIRDLCFSYNEQRPVFDHFNLTASKGDIVVFLAPSGTGKSTLFKLLMAFYEVDDGIIAIAGKPIRMYTIQMLREKVSYVDQESFLFKASILDNIRYGNLNASEEEIVSAAKKANIHDKIISLPIGYQTILMENGSGLSGGERQRIALARSFLKKADIVLLDEPTASLDSGSEEAIRNSIKAFSNESIVLIASHSGTFNSVASHIYTFDSGHLIPFKEESNIGIQEQKECDFY